MRWSWMAVVVLGAGVLVAGWVGAAESKAARPNVVVILADDMGYSDLGCYGSEIRTPNLDGLAKRGVQYTRMYNTARCCPSRAALLTGLYPHQAGVGHMTTDDGLAGYQGHLNEKCVTLAEVLKGAGYQTLMSGKWHVGRSAPSRPLDRGFGQFFGILGGDSNYFAKGPGTPKTWLNDREVERGEGFYFTDAITEQAMKQVEEASREKSPFFLYLAYTAPHFPMQAPAEDVARYKGRYDGGWDKLREERRARMVELGLIDAKQEMAERDPLAKSWEEAPNKADEIKRMEIYAAMVDRLDQNIGRFLKKLDELKVAENTLVLFLADNGGNYERINRYPTKGEIGSADSFEMYGPGWGGASNTPLRRYKHHVYEGGISTPMIAYWPGHTKGGTRSEQVGHVIDLMPTIVEVSGAGYPEKRGEEAVPKMEGVSLVPALEGRTFEHPPIYWEHEGNRAVRVGDWKLVANFKEPWSLYDLSKDRTEMHDLAKGQPERVKEMAGMWDGWAKRVGVVPWEEIQAGRKRAGKKVGVE